MRKCEGSQGWFTIAFSDKLLSNLEETPDEITLRSKNALLANARSGERVNRVECQATYKRLERLDARAYRALLTIDRKLAEISVIDGVSNSRKLLASGSLGFQSPNENNPIWCITELRLDEAGCEIFADQYPVGTELADIRLQM